MEIFHTIDFVLSLGMGFGQGAGIRSFPAVWSFLGEFCGIHEFHVPSSLLRDSCTVLFSFHSSWITHTHPCSILSLLELPPIPNPIAGKAMALHPLHGQARQSWKSQKITLSEVCVHALCLSELQASPEEENAKPSKAEV